MDTVEKDSIEREIERARDGVSESIDALDRRIRQQLDFRSFAADHAPQLVVGGAVVGFLVGFGFPKALRRLIGVGVPLALIAVRITSHRSRT